MTQEIVTVNLSIQRMYRARHEDKDAIAVGPGEVEVPRWVALEWGMIPGESPAPPPKTPEHLAALAEVERLQSEIARLQAALDKTKADTSPAVPFEGYDNLTAADIVALLAGLNDDERAAVLLYETANKARKTVLEALA